MGVVAQDNFATTAAQGIGSAGGSGGGGQGGPDFSGTAATLGVDVADLQAAMPGRP